MEDITVIPKSGLLCDSCGKPLTERKGEKVIMAIDAILTDWGLYCVGCFLKYGVKIKKGYEIHDHLEAGTDVTDSSLMRPIVIASVSLGTR